jgi:diguanylate cyclase (GGDEF)-like protein
LFEMLTELLSQILSYRWMAVYTREPGQFGLHRRAGSDVHGEVDARIALKVPSCLDPLRIENDAARPAESTNQRLVVCNVPFGAQLLGRIAIAPVGDSDTRSVLELVGRELGGPLRMAALMDESQRLATTDPLTGLANRRALLDRLRAEMAHCRRHGPPLSVCLFDVDHFKQINDKRGHAAGDAVLTAVGKLLNGALRTCDLVARWGGEEFVLVLPSTPLEGAEQTAERVRELLEHANIKDANGDHIPVTASFGVATYSGGENLEQVVDRADRAMYLAKSGGRNRVVCDDPQPKAAGAAAE